MASPAKKSVLFVCLGNICRSPIAEAVFRHLVTQAGFSDKWIIDSAATSTYEIGNEPDERGQELMRKKGIPMSHVARQITVDDYRKFNFNFGMDEDNLSNLKRKKPSNSTSVVDFLGSFDPKGEKIIHDPYYGSMNDFVKVYEQCVRCCTAFLAKES